MKIIVKAYQRYGKPAKKPDEFEFCCWKSLKDWLNKHTVYSCDKCKQGKSECIQTKIGETIKGEEK